MLARLAWIPLVLAVPALSQSPADRAAAKLAARGARCEPLGETLLHCIQYFSSLEHEEEFTLHVPPTEPRATIVLLHGLGRDCLTLVHAPESRRVIERSASLIVLPNGRKSWWIDSPGSAYESYVMELLDEVTAALRLPVSPERRGVAGWSMGGFGSLRLIERHPEAFGAWAGILTLADFPNPAYPPEQNHAVPALFGGPSEWKKWQPLANAFRLRGKKIWFSTGAAAFDREMNRALDRRLTELRIRHEYRVVPGRHELAVVLTELPNALHFLESALAAQE